MLVARPRQDSVRHRHVRTADHRANAVQRLRRRRVDRHDTRVRVRAAQDLGVQHPREHDVVRERRASRGLGQPVGATQPATDHLKLPLDRLLQLLLAQRRRGLLLAKIFQLHAPITSAGRRSSRTARAASCTASYIFV